MISDNPMFVTVTVIKGEGLVHCGRQIRGNESEKMKAIEGKKKQKANRNNKGRRK